MWVAIELATLTTVLMVGIYRTHEALEAAWKYFILGSVGIALALFGTILVYMAAQPVVGEGLDAMVWTVLVDARRATSIRRCSTSPSSSCCSATAPRSAWRRCTPGCPTPTPRARRRSRRCCRACCSTSRSMRCCASRCCWRPIPAALAPGPLMVDDGAGLARLRRPSCSTAGATSSACSPIPRSSTWASSPSPSAWAGRSPISPGLLHMTMHSLTKSAIFFAVGHIAQVKGTQKIADIRGLTETHPVLGWGLVLGVVAIAGLPPLGIFMSEFLVVTSTFAREPLLAHAAGRSACWSPSARCCCGCNGIAFGEPRGADAPVEGVLRADVRASRAGARRRRLPAAGAGRLVPARRGAARIDERCRRSPRLIDRRAAGRRRTGPGRASWSTPRLLARARSSARGAASWTLLGLWGERGAVHMALLDEAPSEIAVVSLDCPDGRFPSVGARHPPAIRLERAHPRPLRPRAGRRCPTRGPGSTMAAGACAHPLGAARRRRRARRAYAFLPVEGESLHQIPVGPVHAGIIEPGHFRFTANGETVVRLEERLGYVHKGIEGADGRRRPRARGAARRRASRATAPSPMRSPSRAPSKRRSASRRRRARVWLRALMAELERLANHLGDIGAICNDAAFALMHAQCGVLRERVLRAADACFGHRLMMDRVVPGGVAADLDADGATAIARAGRRDARRAFPQLVELYDNTASLQDRTVATGILSARAGAAVRRRRLCRPRLGRAFDARRALALSALRRARLRRAGADRRRRQCARLDPHPRGRAEPRR